MKATVLVDNIGCPGIQGEWGLSIFIEYSDLKILLDTGASGLFAENARQMGLPLDQVDFGVLSHAHYDHADGILCFLKENSKAVFYLRDACEENCYRQTETFAKYIGIRKGTLKEAGDRIVRVSGTFSPAPGVWLLPHTTPGLEKAGEREKMFRQEGLRRRTDDFAHEQSLIFETDHGLVLFNSCCHGGADVVLKEAAAAFLGKPISALVGGFHLFNKSEDFILQLARSLQKIGVSQIFTGHCTGDPAFELLKRELGDRVQQLRCGLVMDL